MFFENFLASVYPNVCSFCGKKINSDSYTCRNCLSILKYYKERIEKGNSNYSYMINLFEYKGVIKNLIWYFKFRNRKDYGKVLAELVALKLKNLNVDFDIIIPVPISLSRFRERGYNQCEEITKHVSRFLNKKTYSNVLLKIKNNKRQSELHTDDRKNNVVGVYKVRNKEKVKNKKILVLDDVCTTGATINECARMLKNAGAKEVIAITVAYVL